MGSGLAAKRDMGVTLSRSPFCVRWCVCHLEAACAIASISDENDLLRPPLEGVKRKHALAVSARLLDHRRDIAKLLPSTCLQVDEDSIAEPEKRKKST